MIKFRTRMAQEEERYKALDREQAAEVEGLPKMIADSRTEIDKQKLALTDLVKTFGPDHPDVTSTKQHIQEEGNLVERLQKELKERQAKFLAERLRARETIIQLEEEAKSVERRLAIAEREFEAKRAAVQARLQPTGGNPEPRLGEIERKLDTLARELAELRRELKK